VRLSVVIPATDAPTTLDGCLAAIGAAHDPPDEVIVVNEPAGASPSDARNAGVLRAGGEIVMFVDADVLVHTDAFTRVRAAFAADPQLGGVFGSYDDRPGERRLVSDFRNLLHHHVHQSAAGPAQTFWAGLGAIRRDIFMRLGGYDAARYTEASIEDIDLGMRLTAAGARLRLDPGLQGTHLKRWTLRRMLATDARKRATPWVALMLRRGASPPVLNLGWRHRVSALASAATVTTVALELAIALAAFTILVALNASFYALLARRLGPHGAVAGVGLHMLHHLVSIAAVPAGVLSWWRERRSAEQRADGVPVPLMVPSDG